MIDAKTAWCLTQCSKENAELRKEVNEKIRRSAVLGVTWVKIPFTLNYAGLEEELKDLGYELDFSCYSYGFFTVCWRRA